MRKRRINVGRLAAVWEFEKLLFHLLNTVQMSTKDEGMAVSPNGQQADVSGSKVIDKSRIDDFIKHWERIIYPYNEENDQHRAIKTVLVELENVCQAYCR